MKPLRNQVIVITGASHGTGLQLAQRAAIAGANLILVARNKEPLREALLQLEFKQLESGAGGNQSSGDAIAIVADVTDPQEMEFVAREAITHFGRIDAWVNGAAIANFRKITETHLMEKRQIFETNFWGMVHGCRAALPYLRDSHGTLLNIGSADVRRNIYCASKYAVQGYSNSLRHELEQEQSGVQVKCLNVPPHATSDWVVDAAIQAIEERGISKTARVTGIASLGIVGGIAGMVLLRRALQKSSPEQRRGIREITEEITETQAGQNLQGRPDSADQNAA
jgi:short-subunit dehydrogenase